MNLITLFSLKVRQSLQRLGNYQQGSPDDPRIPGCWQCQNLAGSVSIRKGNYVFWGYFDLKEQNIRPQLGNLGAKNITGTTHTVPVNSLKGQEGRKMKQKQRAVCWRCTCKTRVNESHSAASSSDLTQLWKQAVQKYTFLKHKMLND